MQETLVLAEQVVRVEMADRAALEVHHKAVVVVNAVLADRAVQAVMAPKPAPDKPEPQAQECF